MKFPLLYMKIFSPCITYLKVLLLHSDDGSYYATRRRLANALL